eukprot:scaffold14900_cov59-Phaeocystis_antarctica.AAC.1
MDGHPNVGERVMPGQLHPVAHAAAPRHAPTKYEHWEHSPRRPVTGSGREPRQSSGPGRLCSWRYWWRWWETSHAAYRLQSTRRLGAWRVPPAMRADARCTLSRHVGRAIGSAVAEDSVLSHRRKARARECRV